MGSFLTRGTAFLFRGKACMRKQIGLLSLFLWLLLLSTFLLNAHLLLEPFATWFVEFYYLSYLMFPVILLIIKESPFQKAILSFLVGLWICLMTLVFMVLQQAILSIYGLVFNNAELTPIVLSVFFVSWIFIISILCLFIGLVKKIGFKKINKHAIA